jgi:hypothetical protein
MTFSVNQMTEGKNLCAGRGFKRGDYDPQSLRVDSAKAHII